MTLTGKTALVTGGSRGIGRAIVAELTAAGAKVVFTYRQDKAAAEQVDGTAVRVDQADLEGLTAMFEPVRDGFDILVNNVGVASAAPIGDLTPADFDRVFTINTKFPLFAIQAAAPLLRDGGRIVNISTLNTVSQAPG